MPSPPSGIIRKWPRPAAAIAAQRHCASPVGTVDAGDHRVLLLRMAATPQEVPCFIGDSIGPSAMSSMVFQFVVVPPVLVICCTLSSLLTAIVILGRLFSTPLRFQDILRMDAEGDESEGNLFLITKHSSLLCFEGSAGGYGSIGGSGGSGGGLRRRTVSGTSCHSCGGSVGRGLSVSCEELPKPMCRVCSHTNCRNLFCHNLQKHSGNGSSLSLFGSSANGGAPNGSNGTITAAGGSLISRSDSISIGGQSGQRLAHQFSHFNSEGGGEAVVTER